ncbi:5-formyltetrahydrofolate cyclo-ligase [Pseudoxanthobacter soli DSM 19599]|uniref:5-formyltetrahydrofolate cyclo-ligase n=1 Tax=Pseudoxanthobacter soli DSM 19599 TaxID=1123029 RepID=A0A1M7ZL64_9HYPH|nr:5-formyltetrahydrofolate cyclo-ligase [Pseudoxanthobacter soli]SHO65617.1 5-formyltetrahydrofolate cyclo-ligase [Pseudoxanthobacter soli DSM 19599]
MEIADHKASVRERVWTELRKVAVPDSRFHFDFGEFIADFEGSDAAVARLVDHRFYRDADFIFITPDNCLDQLRLKALQDGKTILMTTYSIKRGFWVLDPAAIAPDLHLYASTLDGMERVGRPVTLKDIATMPPVDYMVTGTGAINLEGVRFGKGHGFFDAEWGMLYRIGRISASTPAAAVVHDCQVLDETLTPDVYDTVADVIFTPTRTIEVSSPHKPTCGILWDRLDPHMYETIPPLQELKAMGL